MPIDLCIPILPSRDLETTRRFYEGLGFQTEYWAPLEPGYAIFERGDLRLHFFRYPELRPEDNYAGCYWSVADADTYYEEFRELGLMAEGTPSLLPIEDKPWRMREFAILDPDRNLLRIGHELRGK